jgi:excisionase family DNA binding protein
MTSTILTVSEVSKYLHVSQVTVYRLIRRNDIPAFRIGKKWRFILEDLDRWIEKRVSDGHPQDPHKP